MHHIRRFKEKINESLMGDMVNMGYGYYNMSNSLSIPEAIIPELIKNEIEYIYDPWYNFLMIKVGTGKINIASNILSEIGEGNKEKYGDILSDSALITPITK